MVVRYIIYLVLSKSIKDNFLVKKKNYVRHFHREFYFENENEDLRVSCSIKKLQIWSEHQSCRLSGEPNESATISFLRVLIHTRFGQSSQALFYLDQAQTGASQLQRCYRLAGLTHVFFGSPSKL